MQENLENLVIIRPTLEKENHFEIGQRKIPLVIVFLVEIGLDDDVSLISNWSAKACSGSKVCSL